MTKKSPVRKVKNYIRVAVILGAVSVGAVGCGTIVEEEGNTVIVERNDYESNYTLETVEYADVVLTKTIRTKYKEMYSEDLYLADDGRRVTALYVEKGDEVKKGQLLAELEGSDQSDAIENLKYQISRNQLLLSYTDIDENYEISKRWWNAIYKGAGTQEQVEADVAEIQKKYEYLREDYQDAIELANIKLAGLQEQVTTGLLYAGMDGVVTYIKTDLVGSVSQVSDKVMTIMDNSVCLFEVDDTTYADYFKEGEVVSMKLGLGNSAKMVEVLPYDRENWDKKMRFELVESDTNPEVKANDSGVITLELERREHVLTLPKDVIHTADGKTYVYVLGENDIREVRWVEIGLKGDQLVEVVSGLTEGESVVLR